MSNSWPKVICDPLHGFIPFQDTPCDRLLLKLIDTKEMQRLRRVRQLGMTPFVFPSADHSRFSHSIGVMHIARSFLNRISNDLGCDLDDFQRTAVLVAALLHDLGHGPYSHTFEKITGEDHEKRTLEIIRDESTDIHKCLIENDKDILKYIQPFFDNDLEMPSTEFPGFLYQIVSSQFDADRFDYLLRDSYAAGVSYGRFDINWLIQNLFLNDEGFYVGRKAILTVEQYVFARYHMYQMVYFHKTTRAAEVMLSLLFRRYKELLLKEEGIKKKRGIVPGATQTIIDSFSGKISLDNYLMLDDHSITEFMKLCLKAKDEILQQLADGLLNRKFFKSIDATHAETQAGIGEFYSDAQKLIQKEMNIDPSFVLASDSAKDTPYKPYNLSHQKRLIHVESNGIEELTQVSYPVREIAKPVELTRYYFPASLREKMKKIALLRLKTS